MRRGSRPAGFVVVPLRPGTAFEPPAGPTRSERLSKLALVAGAVAILVGAVVAGVMLLLRSPSRAPVAAPSTASAPIVPAPPTPQPRPAPESPARAKARRIAARLPVALGSAALLRDGSSLYVVGGSERGQPTDAILRVDLASGSAQQVDRFTEPLADAATARRGGVLYLAGGWTGEKRATAVLRWSPGEAVRLVARLPVALRGASAAFAGDRLYVAGGEPRQVFAVDVESGTVTEVHAVPRKARTPVANFDYVVASLG